MLANVDCAIGCSGFELLMTKPTRVVTVVFPQRASRDSNPKPSDP